MVEAALSGAPLGLTAFDDPPEQLLAAQQQQSPLGNISAATASAAAVAAAAPSAAPAPAQGKIAFMFLTRGPLPLAAVWERFFKARSLLPRSQ